MPPLERALRELQGRPETDVERESREAMQRWMCKHAVAAGRLMTLKAELAEATRSERLAWSMFLSARRVHDDACRDARIARFVPTGHAPSAQA